MNPSFQVLRQLYPRKDSREVLFADIGWDDLVKDPAYWDTCAIRMSVGLLRAGVALPGARMQAKAGTIKGKWIEPGQGKLSAILERLWGKAEIYKSEQAARAGIGQQNGVVSFFKIEDTNQGHIGPDCDGRARFSRLCMVLLFLGRHTTWLRPAPQCRDTHACHAGTDAPASPSPTQAPPN